MTRSDATSAASTVLAESGEVGTPEVFASASEPYTREASQAKAATTEYDDYAGLKRAFQDRFLRLVEDSDFEYGFSSSAEIFVAKSLEQFGPYAREWINNLFLQHFVDAGHLTGILRVIAHFRYSEMYPQGMTMATAALLHRSPVVKECGIRCFENWEDRDSLAILENIRCPEAWLQEYLDQVIADLKEEFSRAAVRQKD